MRRWIVAIAVGLAGVAGAAEVSMPVEVLSAYLFRGETRSDGVVVQPALELRDFKVGETELPLTLGIWANFDLTDRENTLQRGAFSEVDLYLLLHFDTPIPKLRLSLGYWEYLFPAASRRVIDAAGEETLLRGEANREVSLELAAEVPLTPGLRLFWGLDGAVQEELYAACDLAQEVPLAADQTLRLGAVLGYRRTAHGGSGFQHLTLSADWRWKFCWLGLDYTRAIDDAVLAPRKRGGNFDVEVVGRAGLVGNF